MVFWLSDIIKHMRTNEWLENRFEYIYRKYFTDLEAPNQIEIKWGRRSRRQLGCIKRERPKTLADHFKSDFVTIIVINSLFKDENIPEYVIDSIIAHEMSHYAHGFNSPLPQKHTHPHKGGVIKKELRERGIHELEKKQKHWIKENWVKYLNINFPSIRKPKIRYKIVWR
jgi:hypothetical protein